jgi:hypothetical protein
MRVEVRPSGGSWNQLDQWDSRDATNGDWTVETYDLSSYTGSTVDLRFWFDSIDSVNND